MVRWRYREDKATQAAARFLRLRGGRMSHLKLIKLLYLAEREALTRLGSPLTYDAYVSMPHGPVLSATLDRINERESYEGGYWDTYIGPKQNNEVALRNRDMVPDDCRVATPHLWVVLWGPAGEDDAFLTVMLTTDRGYTDQTCILDVGDHPFIRHRTSVDYKVCSRWRGAKIDELVKRVSQSREIGWTLPYWRESGQVSSRRVACRIPSCA